MLQTRRRDGYEPLADRDDDTRTATGSRNDQAPRLEHARSRRMAPGSQANLFSVDPHLALAAGVSSFGPPPPANRRRRRRQDAVTPPDRLARVRIVERPAGLLPAPSLATEGRFDFGRAAPGGPEAPVLPANLSGRVAAWMRLLAEPQYALGLTGLLIGRMGADLVAGGTSMVLNVTGRESYSSPLFWSEMIEVSEQLAAVSSMIFAHQMRDLEDRTCGETDREAAERRGMRARGLARCAAASAVTSGLVAAASFGYGANVETSRTFGLALAGVRFVQTLITVGTYGYWGCYKLHCGDRAARDAQGVMNRLTIPLEAVASLGIMVLFAKLPYVVALQAVPDADQLLWLGSGVIAVGAAVWTLPALFFWSVSRRLPAAATPTNRGEAA